MYALAGESISGSLSGGSLTITAPPSSTTGMITSGTLAQSDPSTYNADVVALQKTINTANTQAQAQLQAQAQQQQYAQDSQTASSDLSQVSSGSDFTTDLRALSSDAVQIGKDLTTAKQDASHGPDGFGGSYCSQLTGTVDADVTGTLDADVSGTFSADLSTLTSDISSARQAIISAKAAIATVQADGSPTPDNASTILTNARAAIASAINQANGDISTVNSLDSQVLQSLFHVECSIAPFS